MYSFFSCGATEQIVARPDLHDLLLRQVPRENIHMSKKVIAFEQNDEGVTIHCSDDSIYHGDILVGADGAHSAVREHLFQVLLDKGMLPSVDDGDLPFDCVCLVGQTEVLDPEDFPEMKLPNSKFNSILADDYVVSISQAPKCSEPREHTYNKFFFSCKCHEFSG